jgi:uncharacterized protein
MSETATNQLAPVSGKARIDVLDVLRGIAILCIFFMNIPYEAASDGNVANIHALGWSPADASSWYFVRVALEGTQRGLLELLFGAGMMVFAAKGMTPDSPIAVADLYWRRNLWLLVFGLIDIFLVLWAGDILHVYALAALFLFPFRKLYPRVLLGLGLAFSVYVAIGGTIDYIQSADLHHRVEQVQAKQAQHVPLVAADKATLDEWNKLVEKRATGGELGKDIAKAEAKGRTGGLLPYAQLNWYYYSALVFPSLIPIIAEALSVMLIGVALWKWGVIQGGRSARFYLLLMLACYAVAVPIRIGGAFDRLDPLPLPHLYAITNEIGRVLMSIGHVALINLAMKAAVGRSVLAPFKAAGRTAFSLYFLEQVIGLWILFAPWGPNLWNKLSWSQINGVALIVIALLLIVANLWVRVFAIGPLEWAWRSLCYLKRQPFRLPGAAPALAPAE